MNKAVRVALLCGALAAGGGAAWSHGDGHAHHDGRAVKEQKPWGIAGDARHARTVEIAMGDNLRFRPDSIAVREGETVRFVVRNKGAVLHEMVIGTPEELAKHATLMKRFPGMHHDEPYMAHVAAGRDETLLWNFNRAGTFQFACLVAGHFEAGMTGTIVVASPAKKP